MDQRPSRLDICLVTPQPDSVSDLDQAFRNAGHRTIVTAPDRTPEGTEWESFDLVLVEREQSGRYPDLPVRMINFLVALCHSSELVDPAILRAALKAGARDLLPRNPTFHGWEQLLASIRTTAPRVSLRFIDPATKGERVVHIETERLSIGRDPHNDVPFPQAFVSRRHAKIVRSGSRYRVVDSGSRHGTFVNEMKVEDQVLEDGDQIRLGGRQGPVLTFNRILMTENTLQVLEATGLFDTETVNRQVHDIAVLLETFMSLNGDLLLDEILELVLRRSIEFVQADRGAILLRSSPTGAAPQSAEETLKLAMARDRLGNSLSDDSVQIGCDVSTEVMATGRGSIFEDPLTSEQGATGDQPIRSAMCVPLKVQRNPFGERQKSNAIGVLYVDSETRGRPFSPGNLDALELLAAEVAKAIHSAHLYEDSVTNLRMREEMEIARQIQENIFQKQVHEGLNWELCGTTQPSQRVGGDFLSCFLVNEDRYAIAVGDVSGKGVPAALFSTMIEGLFHGLVAFRPETTSLGSATGELNRFLLAKSRLQKFVTSIFGILQSDGHFHYVNAGHDPGLVLRTDGSFEELQSSGTVLGMFDEPQYKSHTVRLWPGDVLLLFSDGIPESRDPSGVAFGRDHLRQTTQALMDRPSAEIHQGVLDTFHTFLQGVEPCDDVTLMVVKRLSTPPSLRSE